MSFEINFCDQSRPKLQFCLLTACQTEQVERTFILCQVWNCYSCRRSVHTGSCMDVGMRGQKLVLYFCPSVM